MNGMIDFVSNFNLFMSSNDEPENTEDSVDRGDNQDHDLYNREKPKYKKKPLKQIFRMNEKESKKYSIKKNKNIK
tara:strand:+ start:237 stop:461 length:225 start_codon:yes stop_codon:yes gene_type:complete